MIATFESEGSKTAQGDRNVAFFVVYQWVRVVASFVFSTGGFFEKMQHNIF